MTLLSCPFCGGAPRHMHFHSREWEECSCKLEELVGKVNIEGMEFYIKCVKCGSSVSAQKDKESAVNLWNSRGDSNVA